MRGAFQDSLDRSRDELELETPFLDTRFVTQEWEDRERSSDETAPIGTGGWAGELETPFLTEYQGEAPADLEAATFGEILLELRDQEFDTAIGTLSLEAAARAEPYLMAGGEREAERFLNEWLDPLRRETEALFEQAASAVKGEQFETLTDFESSMLDRFAPQPGSVAPEFEEFFKAIGRKVGKVLSVGKTLLKKGISAVGKLVPIGAILKKIGGFAKLVLDRVIRFALKRLPPQLQPAATRLGRRLGILREAEAMEAEMAGATTPSPELPARAFDIAVAQLMLAGDEAEATAFMNEEMTSPAPHQEQPGPAELNAARERLVTRLSQLQAGESPGPAIQEFIPALLPALKVALTVIGRQRVVNFLGGLLTRLIRPLVGAQMARPLSRALADAGLRMIALEAEAESPEREAARAVAATLEDTVRQLAEFGFEQFDQLDEAPDQQQLLEAVATEAFFRSAIAHMPPGLLDVRRLAEREMYLETAGPAGVWAMRPSPRYKKYTRIFDVTVTPQTAARLRSFGTETLAASLRARGVQLPAKARVHLYEAIPGTVLSAIALLEKKVPGLGSAGEAAWSQFHPLTTEAAGLLLNEPGLGRDLGRNFLESRHRIGVGQRFYVLELPRGGGSVVGPKCSPSQLNVAIDLRSSQVRVYLYLGEADAQRILAAGPKVGADAAVQFLNGLRHAVTSMAQGPSNHVKIYQEFSGDLQGEEFWQAALAEAGKKLLAYFLEELGKALLSLLKAALIAYLNRRFEEFAEATRKPACGVTLVFTFNHPGLKVLQVILARRLPGMGDVRAAVGALRPPSVGIVAGFRGA